MANRRRARILLSAHFAREPRLWSPPLFVAMSTRALSHVAKISSGWPGARFVQTAIAPWLASTPRTPLRTQFACLRLEASLHVPLFIPLRPRQRTVALFCADTCGVSGCFLLFLCFCPYISLGFPGLESPPSVPLRSYISRCLAFYFNLGLVILPCCWRAPLAALGVSSPASVS